MMLVYKLITIHGIKSRIYCDKCLMNGFDNYICFFFDRERRILLKRGERITSIRYKQKGKLENEKR